MSKNKIDLATSKSNKIEFKVIRTKGNKEIFYKIKNNQPRK